MTSTKVFIHMSGVDPRNLFLMSTPGASKADISTDNFLGNTFAEYGKLMMALNRRIMWKDCFGLLIFPLIMKSYMILFKRNKRAQKRKTLPKPTT